MSCATKLQTYLPTQISRRVKSRGVGREPTGTFAGLLCHGERPQTMQMGRSMQISSGTNSFNIFGAERDTANRIVVLGDIVFEPGTRIEHYEIVRRLGTGGMGLVFLARDTRLARLVAIKFLRRIGASDTSRFLAEARMTARCQHENIVVVHEVSEFQGYPFMVLEYVDGRSFRQIIEEEREPRTVAHTIELIMPVLRAVICAHAMGIIHRDLKPENILLGANGTVKVVDFGISKPDTVKKSNGDAVRMPAEHDVLSTQTSALLGTLPYMSPEQWRQESIDVGTDIWALGILLFELLTGAHPLAPASMRELSTVRSDEIEMPSLREKRPDAAGLIDIVDCCLRKRKHERYASASELLEALSAIARESLPSSSGTDDCPFTGLAPFQEVDAGRFFGRERDVFAVMNLLRHQEIVFVAGRSGAGKSSFVRAGVIPAFKRTYRRTMVFVARPGRQPVVALAEILHSLGQTAAHDDDVATLAKALKDEPGRLGTRLRAAVREQPQDVQVLLFVDQLEELFTLGADVHERNAFLSCLEGVADDASSPLRVIASVRADFLDRCAEEQRLAQLVSRGLFLLPQLGREAMVQALTNPLALAGYRLDDDSLVDEMLAEIQGSPSALPLLQFAAMKWWQSRDIDARVLTRAAYTAQGGVVGALSAHADAVFLALTQAEQSLARTIFLRLVTPERTRAIVALDELIGRDMDAALVDRIVNKLVDARLLSIGQTADPRGVHDWTIELAHESMIERWERLSQWASENEQDRQFLAQLRTASANWERNAKSEGLLWRDEAAKTAADWLERQERTPAGGETLGIAAREEQYLRAVVSLAHRAQRWRRRIAMTIAAALVVVTVVVSILAARARNHAVRAEHEALEARNAARVAAAREWQSKDPTTVLALVREAEKGATPRGWESLASWSLRAGVARAVLDHKDILQSASYSPNGKMFATGGWDKAIHLWSADGTNELRVFRGHDNRVYSVAFSPDSQRIVSGSADATVRIWNVDGSGEPIVLRGHKQVVTMAAWSPDGKRIASSSVDKTVRIWDIDRPEKPRVLEGHGDRVNSVAFSPDGQHVVSGAWDNTVRIWNADGTGQPLVLQGHTARVHCAAYSPDGKRIASGSVDKTIRVWNADGTGQPLVLEGHTDRVAALVFTPDGERIVSVSTDKTVRVWNADGTGQTMVLEGHSQRIDGVAVSPDGQWVVSAASDSTARIWDIRHATTPSVFRGHLDTVQMAAFSPDGKRIVSASGDKSVRIWSADGTGTPVVLLGHAADVTWVAFSPDGKQVASGSADKTIRIWNADGAGDAIVLKGHQSPLQMVRWSPDGTRLVSAANDMTVRIWDIAGSTEPIVLTGHKDVVASAVFSRDGTRVLSGSWDKTIRIWNADGRGEAQIIQASAIVNSAVWSPDEQRIYAGIGDTIRIWTAQGSSEPTALLGYDTAAGLRSELPFTPDGKRILTGSRDGAIRIWNADGTGEALMLQASKLQMNTASFSPDGQSVVVASDDHTVIILHDLEPLQGSSDSRLWNASRYCMPLDVRRRLLGFGPEQSRADLAACEQRVRDARQ